MKGAGLEAGRLREALRRAAGGRRELGPDRRPFEELEEAANEGRLARARAPGHDQQAGGVRDDQRPPLLRGQLEARRTLEVVGDHLRIVDQRAGQPAGDPVQVSDHRGFGAIHRGRVDRIGVLGDHDSTFVGQRPKRALDVRVGPQQGRRGVDQPRLREEDVAFLRGFGQRVHDPGLRALGGAPVDPEPGRDAVGGPEPHSADVEGEPKGLGLHHVDSPRPVAALNLGREVRWNAQPIQEDHRGPQMKLVGEGLPNTGRAHLTDPFDLGQPLGRLLDDLQRVRAEGLHEPGGQARAEPLDESGRQIRFDALGGFRGYWHRGRGSELSTILGIFLPAACDLESRAGGGGGYRPHDGHRSRCVGDR